MPKSPDLSTRCAAAILKAWRQDDLDLLDRKLARAAVVEELLSDDSGESERRELLTGIAREVRRILACGGQQEALVYMPLLENLAHPGARPCRRAAGLCSN